ncbi:MAG TPA: sugar phosphate isomerase/epimerase family protein [Acidimicrobiales bacterium]|nr:sugar phosphate isomerase/epimerase family protein [Acidimicrobiales bacterium]
MPPSINLSTSSVFPNTELGFRLAADHGFDGVEVMVNHDRNSQTVEAVQALSATYGVPIRSVHVPCLIVSQHVWGFNPELKLRRSVEMATAVGAEVVVVHPPFRWQREYAASFAALVDELTESEGGPTVTVENMYTVEALGRTVRPYLADADEDFAGYQAITLDTSHAGADRRDVLELYDQWRGRVAHLHLSDSTTSRGDEHLPPGMGTLPLADLAGAMVRDDFAGHVVLEVGIGRLPEATRDSVAADCAAFAREAFGASR